MNTPRVQPRGRSAPIPPGTTPATSGVLLLLLKLTSSSSITDMSTCQDVNPTQVAADILCEFLEVAVHMILYVRQLYPLGIFEKRRKYNVPVQMSCHPEVNKYIEDTLHCIRPLLEQNAVEQFVVAIVNKENKPVERFVFEISPPNVASHSLDEMLAGLERALRAFLLKISVADSILEENPADCSFTIFVHTLENAIASTEVVQMQKSFPLVQADEEEIAMSSARMVPLKTMSSAIFKMQMYVEESSTKT
ncbi:mitotic spindle assembly checkpoint protein MAD2B isoform X3 [Lampetra planeri]